MAKVDGAIILARALQQAGVEKVFTLCGGHIFRLNMECERLGIQVIDTRHEEAATYAALAYAHMTGKPGVMIATAGPGVMNTVTGLCDAKSTGVPLIVIGGGAPLRTRLQEDLQEFDTVSLLSSCTNWSACCCDTMRVAEYFSMAYRHCVGVSSVGPVYVEYPMDILEETAVEENEVLFPVNYVFNGAAGGDPDSIERAAELLIQAERPAMLLGEGINVGCKDPAAFRELAEYLQIPVNTARSCRGVVLQENQPLFRTGDAAAKSADVILFFSVKPDRAAAKGYSPDAKYISVSRYGENIGLNRPVEVGIPGFPDVVARQILNAVKSKTAKRESSAWVDQLEAGRQAGLKFFLPKFTDPSLPLTPARLSAEIEKFMNGEGADYALVADGGDCMIWYMMGASMLMDDTGKFPGRTYYGTRLGTIGCGMGTVTGVYAATGHPILHATGDGSMGELVGEFFTFAKHSIPVITVISNDANYAMIDYGMVMSYKEESRTDVSLSLKNADGGYFHYEKIAEAFGGYGEYVTDPDEILPAILRAKASGKPSIINVITSSGEHTFSPGTASMMGDFHIVMADRNQ